MLNSNELINKVKNYNKFLNPEKLDKAYNFAVKAHKSQKRASGDPYSVHPIEVANILTELKLDSATITTGLLHDTIEDTFATYDTIKQEFGDEVADLVDGVTLSLIHISEPTRRYAISYAVFCLKKNSKINLPHKMMHKRNFVLFPLFEIQKNWIHPDKQIDVKTLISLLPDRDIRSIKQI